MKLRITRIAVAVAVLPALAFAGRAQAQHIPGATYNGTVTGGAALTFTVAPDGSSITDFTVTGNVQGDSCTWTFLRSPNPVPIVNDAFSATGSVLSYSGTFNGPQSAQGTLRAHQTYSYPLSGSCDSGDVAWTATTTATPPDKTPPVVKLTGKTSQRIVAQKGLVLVVGSPAEGCTATITGTVAVGGRSLKFVPVTKQIGKAGKATIKLKLSSASLKKVKKALAAGKKLRAKVTVTSKDAAGNTTITKRTITLKK